MVDATGPAFTSDPDRRAVFALSGDATNYLRLEGTHVEVEISNVHEIATVDRIAVANDTLELPPLTSERDDGHVKPGDHVSDCVNSGARSDASSRVLVNWCATPASRSSSSARAARFCPYVSSASRCRRLVTSMSKSTEPRIPGTVGDGSPATGLRRRRPVLFDDDRSEIVNRRQLAKR